MCREPVRVEHRAHPVHQRQRVVDLPDCRLRERAIGPLVVRERRLPLSPVVVDLAEREVQVALGDPVGGALHHRGADAVLVLVGPRREALRLREVERGLGEAGVEPEGGPVGLAGGVKVPDGGVDDPGVVADLGRVGIELDGAERLGQRLLLPAQLDQGAGQPRPDRGVTRRERRRLAQDMFRAHQIVHVQQRPSEIETGGGVAGVVGEGGFVAGNRLLPFLALLKQVAEAVVRDGDGRMPAEQAPVQVDGEVGAAGLARDGGEQVQGVGLIRHGVEHAAGELLRLARVPGAVRVEGASEPSHDAGVGAGMSRAPRCRALSSSAHSAAARKCRRVRRSMAHPNPGRIPNPSRETPRRPPPAPSTRPTADGSGATPGERLY